MFLTKRASRTGPSAVMNDGTWLVAPSSLAMATCGLGLLTPTPTARAASAGGGLRMAAGAAIQVEARAEALARLTWQTARDGIDLVEALQTIAKKIQLIWCQPGDGSARARIAAADARVVRTER